MHLAWLSCEDFGDLVKEVWESHDRNILQTFQTFTARAKWWSRESFGNTRKLKHKCLARLEGVQKELALRQSGFLENLYSRLEYEELLRREEIYHMQRSHERGLIQGECNTKYFHVSVLAKRAKSKIL